MNYIILICSLRPGSRSRVLACAARDDIAATGASVELIDLVDYPLPLCDATTTSTDPKVIAISEKIAAADGILMAVPIYIYGANAATKNVIDLGGQGWANKVVGFLCAAGGQGSYMAVMSTANQLMLNFRCVIVPRFVYATGGDFQEDDTIAEEVRARVNDLAVELTTMTAKLRGRETGGVTWPSRSKPSCR